MITFWDNPYNKHLSNFYLVELELGGKKWPSVEHYYQAQKTEDETLQEEIRLLTTPGKAKRRGQKLELRKDWELLKFEVMLKALLKKFEVPELKEKLLATSGVIIEDSPKDLIWGSGVVGSEGPGLNMLGKMLMLTRAYYKKELVFPLKGFREDIPLSPHAGAFGTQRKFDVHTGIDLYTTEGSEVLSMASGEVIKIVDFTGTKAQSPWWEDTSAVLVKHDFGVVLYGEMKTKVKPNQKVKAGEILGSVKRVLKKDKGLPQSMLHLEWYKKEVEDGLWWKERDKIPELLLDPTTLLKLCQENS